MQDRIPLEAFTKFDPTFYLHNGANINTTFDDAMAAYEAARIERKKQNEKLRKSAALPDWRNVYVVGWAESVMQKVEREVALAE